MTAVGGPIGSRFCGSRCNGLRKAAVEKRETEKRGGGKQERAKTNAHRFRRGTAGVRNSAVGGSVSEEQ